MNKTQIKKTIHELNEIIKKNNECYCFLFVDPVENENNLYTVSMNTYKNQNQQQEKFVIEAENIDEAVKKSKDYLPEGCIDYICFINDFGE